MADEQLIPLEYARPLTDADRLPEAEALLLRGAPWKQFRALFKSTKDAAEFYVRFQVTHYGPANVGRQCCWCGCENDQVVRCHSMAVFQLQTLELAISNTGYQAYYDTYHSLCPACLAVTAKRIRQYRKVIATRIALVLVAIGYLIWTATDPRWIKELREDMGWYFYAPPMVAILVAIVSLAFKERQANHRLPPAIQAAIGRDWTGGVPVCVNQRIGSVDGAFSFHSFRNPCCPAKQA